MKSKYFFRIFYSLFVLGIISLSFTGSSCNDIIDALTNTGDVAGTWNLTEQGGVQYDVCPQEVVTFSTNTATLKCPNSTPLTRSYTAASGVLTYTETGISYDYNVSTSGGVTTLSMNGKNGVNRILKYTKQVTDNQSAAPQVKTETQNFKNSSDLK